MGHNLFDIKQKFITVTETKTSNQLTNLQKKKGDIKENCKTFCFRKMKRKLKILQNVLLVLMGQETYPLKHKRI